MRQINNLERFLDSIKTDTALAMAIRSVSLVSFSPAKRLHILKTCIRESGGISRELCQKTTQGTHLLGSANSRIAAICLEELFQVLNDPDAAQEYQKSTYGDDL